MGDSYVQPGQQVSAGDVLGGMGAMGSLDATHVHFEAIGYCDALGTYVYLDPTLVVNGYYSTQMQGSGLRVTVGGQGTARLDSLPDSFMRAR